MAKTYIGKTTLAAVMALFKNALNGKQDLMNEFTDEQIQDMWDTEGEEEPAEETEVDVNE